MPKDLELHVQRDESADKCTLGSLTENGAHICFSLEDEVRPAGVKVYGQTAIPAGRYRVVLTMSKRFGKVLPELQNVPGFAGVRIHGGNGPADTLGCILVGNHKGKGKIWDCAPALQRLIDKMELCMEARGRVFLTIS
jgi:hypothetical protein